MGKVILPHIANEIIQQMLELRKRSSMVEVALFVGKDEYQSATNLDHPLPFHKRFDGVGDVLQAIGRQKKIVSRSCDFT
jgi:hypothetical protein